MVQERDDRDVRDETLNDVAGAERDDYLTADRVAAIDDPSTGAPAGDEEGSATEADEASTFGAP